MEDLAIKHKDFGDRFDCPEKCIGYTLCDAVGEKIGTVEKLFINDHGVPEYINVKLPGLFGSKKLLLPVESLTVDERKRTLTLR